MDKKEIYEKLIENLRRVEAVENEISMIQVELFKRNTEKLKKEKFIQIAKDFENKAKVYNQNIENYKTEIEPIIKKYGEQMSKIINVYYDTYVNAFKTMQESICNKNVAIANIVKLERFEEQEEMEGADKNEKQRLSRALAQKKLNYEVIIAECRARMSWCIEEAKKDINNIYTGEVELMLRKSGFIEKLKMYFSNKIYGKRKYMEYLEFFKSKRLKQMEYSSGMRILEISAVLSAFQKQMKSVKDQIKAKFDEDVRG